MAVCTFFGHRDCPDSIKPLLREKLEDLIVNQNTNMFYVGNQGRFDTIVRSVLQDLSTQYPYISYAVVLAYMPGKSSEGQDDTDTILPEGIEFVHPRYAIIWRNNWMIRQSDFVVTYVVHSWGGAAEFARRAVRQKKTVYNLFA